jgi:hypothetical protein
MSLLLSGRYFTSYSGGEKMSNETIYTIHMNGTMEEETY